MIVVCVVTRVNGCCNGVCGYCYAIGVQHTGAKSGCKLVTLFDSYSYDGVSAGIWVIHIEGCQIWVQDGHAF